MSLVAREAAEAAVAAEVREGAREAVLEAERLVALGVVRLWR